jgi:hypothetical protein
VNALIVLKHGRVSGVNTFSRSLSILLKRMGYKVYFNVIQEHTPYYNYITEHAYGYYNEQTQIDVCFHNYNSSFERYSAFSLLNVFVTHGTQHAEYAPPKAADLVLCLSGQQFDFYRHENRLLFPSIIEVKNTPYFPARKELKKVLLCDLRYGHFYQEKVKEACGYLGIEFDYIGQHETNTDMLGRMNDYDLIIGYGRCIIEALSIGKCVIVYGWNGGDGYMSIKEFENFAYKNFSGYSKRSMLPPQRMEALDFYTELKKYDYIDGMKLKRIVIDRYSIESEIVLFNEYINEKQ